MAKFSSFLWLSSIWLYIYTISSLPIHLLMGHLGWFYLLSTINNAVMNIGVHVSFSISVLHFFGYIPRSGTAGSYHSSNFLRNLRIIFHSGCINLHFHQQCTRVPFSPRPHQQLLFVFFLIIVILTGVRWYIKVVFIFFEVVFNLHFSDD